MEYYKLYCLSYNGSEFRRQFSAHDDDAASIKGGQIVDGIEKKNDCNISREYLYRINGDGSETEIAV